MKVIDQSFEIIDPAAMAESARVPVPGRMRQRLCCLILLSLGLGICFIAFRGGLGDTSYVARDSAGRTMGFNDLFSAEHYGIILSNVSIKGTLRVMAVYEYAFIAVHVFAIGLILLAGDLTGRWMLRFFFLQFLVFPWGILGMFFLPSYIKRGAALSLDREAFIDVPFIWLCAHAVWIMIAALIGWRLWLFERR